MDKTPARLSKIERMQRHSDFLDKLKTNELTIPNEFTIEMGKLIKKARDEKSLNQSQLAERMSRSQATISDLENGKLEVGIFTLMMLAIALDKPISYFIPEMTFLSSINDIQNKYEEEALSIFRALEYEGDSELALRFMKMLYDYNSEQAMREWEEPLDEEEQGE